MASARTGGGVASSVGVGLRRRAVASPFASPKFRRRSFPSSTSRRRRPRWPRRRRPPRPSSTLDGDLLGSPVGASAGAVGRGRAAAATARRGRFDRERVVAADERRQPPQVADDLVVLGRQPERVQVGAERAHQILHLVLDQVGGVAGDRQLLGQRLRQREQLPLDADRLLPASGDAGQPQDLLLRRRVCRARARSCAASRRARPTDRPSAARAPRRAGAAARRARPPRCGRAPRARRRPAARASPWSARPAAPGWAAARARPGRRAAPRTSVANARAGSRSFSSQMSAIFSDAASCSIGSAGARARALVDLNQLLEQAVALGRLIDQLQALGVGRLQVGAPVPLEAARAASSRWFS